MIKSTSNQPRNLIITTGIYWILLLVKHFGPESWEAYCIIGLTIVAFIAAYQILKITSQILEIK